MNTLLRRQFLVSALGAAAGATVFREVFAQSGPVIPKGPIVATQLSDSVSLFTGAGPNVLAARGPDGIVIVDGGFPERSRALLKAIEKEMGSKKVTALFNTHWHAGHTGLNERLGKEGVKIIAHENTKLWLSTDVTVQWQNNRVYKPLPEKARPTDTIIYKDGKLALGDEEIQYGYVPQAHTDGDIYVFLPKANVLAAGGIVSGEGWPNLDYSTGGWIGGLVAGAKKLIEIANDQTRIVPGNGPVLTKADLVAQQAMFAQVYDRLSKSIRKGLGPDEAYQQKPAAEWEAKYGDSKQFVTLAFRSLWGHMAPDA
jgi:glyoxylase-like metal-dependent hydrolase (beta-lactamase superfamily II)